jgi:excisionase family DNA binding protein
MNETVTGNVALDPLLDVNQVARILLVSRDSVYRLVDRKELTCVRIARALRFRRDDLANYIGRRVTMGSETNDTPYGRAQDQ